jgi:DEAD/DEAH box helicase domain-containing protein
MRIDDFIEDITSRADTYDAVHRETLPERKPVYGSTAAPLLPQVEAALDGLGITGLYSHQAAGIDAVRARRNVVVMTPAASGKSLVYNIPVVESILVDPASRALYLFPLKGLEQDQLASLNGLAQGLALPGPDARPGARSRLGPVEIYDGDTPAGKRARIRESPPSVILTNPDMLHLSINAYHGKWEGFLRGLDYVVIDEVHAYRGIFGSHVAHVLRRLRRIAALYGKDPVFIACSATIANPRELAGMLTGVPFELVQESGAPIGERTYLFVNPAPGVSPYTAATRLFVSAIRAGFKTIAFTKARKVTELMHAWAREAAPELAGVISSYRAGYLPAERREIEKRLFGGSLSGVITTSALELGVDIGGVDVCILVGYPGTISSTLQMSGRAGRKGRASLTVLVALNDALDQHFMRNPSDFFARGAEAAVLDPENPTVLKAHLLSAASEAYLRPGDAVYDTARHAPILRELEAEGMLRHWEKGGVWYPRTRHPQRLVSIRDAGRPYRILGENGRAIGEASSTRVFHELHPGAVYLHRGAQFEVVRLDVEAREASCRAADEVDYYTNAITQEENSIISTEAERRLDGVKVSLGRLRATVKVLGYVKRRARSGERLGEFPLDLPETVFSTVGVWMSVEEALLSEIKGMGYGAAGSLHAAEHALIATLPLFAMCDRNDLGGVSYSYNEELKGAAIFVHDGHEGGVGLTRMGFERAPEWFSSARRIMEECPCEVSCPSCTQDPRCGSGNDPLDKRGAVMIIGEWLEGRRRQEA